MTADPVAELLAKPIGLMTFSDLVTAEEAQQLREALELGLAWAACEAALPEGWHVGEVKNTAYRAPGERWMVMAWEFTDDPDYRTFKAAYGDTAIEALLALAALLREAK